MRCQEEGGEEEDDPPLVPRLGTRTGSTLLFSTTTRFSDMKQKRNYSFLTSRSIAKTSYTIRSSGVLLQTGRVFLMTFIVGVKSYIEVSNETSDTGTLCMRINQILSKLNFPAKRYAGFEPLGVSNIATLARSKCKTPISTMAKWCSMKF